MFDEDLRTLHENDAVEHFDAARFVLHREVMLEAGERSVVWRSFELPVDFVTSQFTASCWWSTPIARGVELRDAGEELDYVEKGTRWTPM